MTVNFTKVGGLAMIQAAGGATYIISGKPDFCLTSPMSVKVMSDFGYLSYDLTAITDIQVGGVAVLSQSDFLVQIATVFPNINSGSGGTATWGGIIGTLSAQTDLFAALNNRALVRNITAVKTANYTAVPSDFIPVDTTSGNIIITLPTAPPNISMIGVKMVIQGGANTVIVNTGGTDTINKIGGVVTRSLVLLNQDFILQYSNGIWYVVTESLNLATLDVRYGTTGGTDYTGFESTGSTSIIITLPQTPRAGQLGAVKQFKNGVRLPNSKWSITGAVITLVDTPLTTDLFQSDFKY